MSAEPSAKLNTETQRVTSEVAPAFAHPLRGPLQASPSPWTQGVPIDVHPFRTRAVPAWANHAAELSTRSASEPGCTRSVPRQKGNERQECALGNRFPSCRERTKSSRAGLRHSGSPVPPSVLLCVLCVSVVNCPPCSTISNSLKPTLRAIQEIFNDLSTHPKIRSGDRRRRFHRLQFHSPPPGY